MFPPTVDQALDELGPGAAADLFDGVCGGLADGEDVAVLDPNRGHPETGNAGAQVFAPPTLGQPCVDGVAVVLADEKHRQIAQGGEIQALVKNAFFGGAVAEKAGYDIGPRGLFDLQGEAQGNGNVGADHGRGAENVLRHAHQVHGAPLAGGAARLLAVHFRHHRARISTLGQIERMAAIGAGDHVFCAQHITHPDRDRFLADRQMNRAFDLVLGINLGDPFFHAPDKIQGPVETVD